LEIQWNHGLLAPTEAMTQNTNDVSEERLLLGFTAAATEAFAHLENEGFSRIESLPTLVRFEKDGLEVDIYHGRQSFEIGFGISRNGTRYSLFELIRTRDPRAAEEYRDYAATTRDAVAKGVARLALLVERYAASALENDPEFFKTLDTDRKAWADVYALDDLEREVRPKAAVAFRTANYREAAELYESIRPRLSAAELKKLEIAKTRALGQLQ
jgi:hypothetical protein